MVSINIYKNSGKHQHGVAVSITDGMVGLWEKSFVINALLAWQALLMPSVMTPYFLAGQPHSTRCRIM